MSCGHDVERVENFVTTVWIFPFKQGVGVHWKLIYMYTLRVPRHVLKIECGERAPTFSREWGGAEEGVDELYEASCERRRPSPIFLDAAL